MPLVDGEDVAVLPRAASQSEIYSLAQAMEDCWRGLAARARREAFHRISPKRRPEASLVPLTHTASVSTARGQYKDARRPPRCHFFSN